MGLTLITGLSNVGRSGLLYRGVRADASRGEAPVVLFPAAPDARRAAREFASGGALGVRTAVFDRWVADVWGAWGDGRRLVDRAQRTSLVAEALERTDTPLLSKSARYSGFARALASVARQISDTDELTSDSPYDLEVRAVLATYVRLLEQHGLVEPITAARALSKDPPDDLPPLYVNRFTDLSSAQESLLVSLARVTSVSVVLPWKRGHAATAALEGLVQRLACCGEHQYVEGEAPDDELGLLGASLFVGGEPLGPTGMVRLGEVPDPGSEVTCAIDLAAEALREGADPSRIVITFRSAALRTDAVIAASGEAGIPLYVDLQIPLVSTPITRALLALLDAVTGQDDSRERLAAYLQSVYSGLTPEQAARFDRRIRLERGRGVDMLQDAERLGGGAARAVRAARLLTGKRQTPSAANWKELADALVANAAEAWTEDNGMVRLDAASHAGVLGVVESIAGVSIEPRIPSVRSALDNESVHFVIGDESTGVHFTEASRVRSTRYDIVILGGMNAKEFSSDSDPSWGAGFLERAGLGTEAEERTRERLLFYSLVTRARNRLVLLRSTGEAEVREARPSIFWNEVGDRYRDGVEEDSQLPDIVRVPRPGDQGRTLTTAVAHTPGRRSERGDAQRLSRPVRGTRLRGEVLERLSSADEYSATEIEAYLGCPRRWFFGHVLNPKEIDTELGLREWGSAAHEILALFYRSWVEDLGRGRIDDETCPSALVLLEEVTERTLDRYPDAVSAEEGCGVQAVRQRTRGVIEDDVRYLPGFEPAEVEMKFGARYERTVEFGGAKVRGSIDRVDIGGESLFITDYKSGATVKGHSRFTVDGLVQLPVYAVAAAEILGSRPVGAVYRSLSTRKARGFWLSGAADLCEWGTRTDSIDGAGFALVIEEAEERVSAAVAGMRAGVVEPTPGQGCRYCGAAPVCEGGGAR